MTGRRFGDAVLLLIALALLAPLLWQRPRTSLRQSPRSGSYTPRRDGLAPDITAGPGRQ